ncbi:MAG: YciI family protein [Halioglobus sp.]|nr:YciI family protein [Halioglobus sp.]
MKAYIITYFGGDHPDSPEEGQRHFAKYQQWLGSLGEHAVTPMQPYRDSHTIDADGNASTGSRATISGHTVVQAPSIEEAIDIARGCPFLEINGTLEVAELVRN